MTIKSLVLIINYISRKEWHVLSCEILRFLSLFETPFSKFISIKQATKEEKMQQIPIRRESEETWCYFFVHSLMWFHWRIQRAPPTSVFLHLTIQILSFRHANILKRSRIGSPHPSYEVGAPYGKSWIGHWIRSNESSWKVQWFQFQPPVIVNNKRQQYGNSLMSLFCSCSLTSSYVAIPAACVSESHKQCRFLHLYPRLQQLCLLLYSLHTVRVTEWCLL